MGSDAVGEAGEGGGVAVGAGGGFDWSGWLERWFVGHGWSNCLVEVDVDMF